MIGASLTARWLTDWEVDFGFEHAEGQPQIHVPKAIMEERLEIGWCSGARIRALCCEAHGHEPEMEIWDQPPFP